MFFSYHFQCLNLNMKKKMKIWKSNTAATSDGIMLLWLPWKLIRCHVTILSWKYTGQLLHIPSLMSIGLILFKIEGGPIDTPPSLSSCNFVSSCLLGLRWNEVSTNGLLYKDCRIYFNCFNAWDLRSKTVGLLSRPPPSHLLNFC